MDVDPSESNDRQEPIITDNSCNARVEGNDELVNDLWRMRIEALFTSLDEAEHFGCTQPTKWQEILTNFLRMAHLYKPSDSYKICQGLNFYMFREFISEAEGQLV